MSYTYLQEQGEESSADTYSDIPASVLSSGHPTRGGCCCNGSETACCHGSRCGMMSRRSTVRHGAVESMSSAADSHARTSAPQETEQASTASGLECGDTWPASLARFDPATSSWKTRQFSLLGGSASFSETWPRSGTMRSGVCWVRPTLEPLTSGTGSGFWPTPTAQHNVQVRGLGAAAGNPKRGTALAGAVRVHGGTVIQPTYPTPTASMMPCEGSMRMGRALLDAGIPMDEATAIAGRDPRLAQGKLRAMAYPTPVASEGADCGSCWPALAKLDKGGRIQRRMATMGMAETMTTKKAALNPAWVEWLMAWPIGWTDLEPLATGRFRRWLRLHGAR